MPEKITRFDSKEEIRVPKGHPDLFADDSVDKVIYETRD
jgi:hypothetical protein